MCLDTRRVTRMDAQRFDFAKSRKASNLSISASITLEPNTTAAREDVKILADSPTEISGNSWEGLTVAVLSTKTSLSYSEESTDVDSLQSTSEATSSTSSLVIHEATFLHKSDTRYIDVFEHEDYTTIRTIIRPSTPSRPNILGLFSKPSLERLISRSTSPLGIRLGKHKCMSTAEALEEELDFIQEERTPLHIRVDEDRSVLTEERWRSPVQAILYERARRTDSVVGYVEVC